ncbi:hypothetical protein, partial [Mesorhizobium sp.]|uniref:hypothetical protein n=1 Tax=Mesorhizobium sp. TaxID=1871066 RepID=UPI0034552529
MSRSSCPPRSTSSTSPTSSPPNRRRRPRRGSVRCQAVCFSAHWAFWFRWQLAFG